MHSVDKNVPIVSIGFDGYDLESAIRGLAKTDSKNVILCCIDGFTKHVIPEEMSQAEWERSRDLVRRAGLNFYGLFGHCSISSDEDLAKLEKRMRYTRFMGGDYIDTNAGPAGTEKRFYKNLARVVDLAEELDLTVCLETHGDMIRTGADGHRLFEKIRSPRIRISYDAANVYFYNEGTVDPAADLQEALPHVGMVHFKGVHHNQDKSEWGFPLIEESVTTPIFDYDRFFDVLQDHRYAGMVAIELEGRFRHVKGKGFVIDPVWPEGEVVDKYNRDISYLAGRLSWM
jgi:sugar phosphate isomerase/epimerase